MRPTVLLFDIDGTLVSTGGAGRRAMQRAFVELHDRDDACAHFSFAGMTDRAIVREGIRRVLEREPEEAAIDRLLTAYLAHLGVELAETRGYQIMPGVLALLERLERLGRDAALAVGLGTGNVKRGAYAKLARGALDDAFAFGGFGCDAEDRAELLRHGARRGAESLGSPVERCRVVVIGDTPRDVAAALAIGAECVGVGTGGVAPEALADLGAAHAFATLEDARALAVLTGP